MTDDKPARRAFDWESIEAQFRAGVKSTVEIAKEFGLSEAAIRKRAVRDFWERDLSEKVRRGVRAAQVRAEKIELNQEVPVRERPKSNLDEAAIVKAAVVTRIDISDRQRASIDRLRRIADAIVSRVEELNPKTEINDFIDADKAMGVVAKATTALGQLIALERQSWAMDEPAAQTAASATDDLIKRLAAMSKQD
jgi:transposase-like protein